MRLLELDPAQRKVRRGDLDAGRQLADRLAFAIKLAELESLRAVLEMSRSPLESRNQFCRAMHQHADAAARIGRQ
jgi:hypothetical protein